MKKNRAVEFVGIDKEGWTAEYTRIAKEKGLNIGELNRLIAPKKHDGYISNARQHGTVDKEVFNALVEYGADPEIMRAKEPAEGTPENSLLSESVISIEINTATIATQNREIIKLLTAIANSDETGEPVADVYPLIVSTGAPNNTGMNQNTQAAFDDIQKKRYTEIYLGSGKKSVNDQPHVMGVLNLIARNGYTLVMTPALNEQGRPYIAVMLYNGDGNWPHGYKGADK